MRRRYANDEMSLKADLSQGGCVAVEKLSCFTGRDVEEVDDMSDLKNMVELRLGMG